MNPNDDWAVLILIFAVALVVLGFFAEAGLDHLIGGN